MRKTKRNIARKPKATKANRIPAITEPFASAEGHTSHSEITEPPQTSTTASANGASQKSSHANATPTNRDASTRQTETFASAEGPGSPSTNAAPPLRQAGIVHAPGFVPYMIGNNPSQTVNPKRPEGASCDSPGRKTEGSNRERSDTMEQPRSAGATHHGYVVPAGREVPTPATPAWLPQDAGSETDPRPLAPDPCANGAPRQTEPFASAEGPGSPSTNAAPPLRQAGIVHAPGFVPYMIGNYPSQTVNLKSPQGASAGREFPTPATLAWLPQDAGSETDPRPLAPGPCANGASGFVSQPRQGNGLPSFANSAAPPETCLETGIRNPAPDTSDSDLRANRNRQNAQRSTGPRTPEGKAASSQNARKHGLSIQRHVILEHEDPADYARLREELSEIYQPQSPREHLALEAIAESRWALNRFDEGELTLLECHYSPAANPAIEECTRLSYGEALAYSAIAEPGTSAMKEYPSLLLLLRYRSHWDRRHQRALAEFDRARRDRRQEAADIRKEAEAQRKAAQQATDAQRKQEVHELRAAILKEKLHREQQRNAKARRAEEDTAFRKAMEDFLQAPPAGLTAHQLAALGFVSSPQLSETAASESDAVEAAGLSR